MVGTERLRHLVDASCAYKGLGEYLDSRQRCIQKR